ncbi:hypothetical protein [Acaryochloris sp. IP29b_bin.137]|uniref:hypothetical protein n=1 Tax=Acaryochloris sp. IP29b_bin.137 TaxID=2969217 RepID=UPI002607C7B7|nr:hypothetical protein [Acaryochloris sp. IP29b_bin.137]
MRIIQVQNLQAQDLRKLNSTQLLFHGQLFRLGPKISKKLENAALEYCQICCNLGQACLLQEDDSHWIIWKHVKAVPQPAVPDFSPQPQSLPDQKQTLSPQFIEKCQQELADCIGPIAELVIEQTLSDLASVNLEPRQFISVLSQKIPSSTLVSKFQADCKGATDKEVMAARIRSIKIASPEPNHAIQSRRVPAPVSI